MAMPPLLLLLLQLLLLLLLLLMMMMKIGDNNDECDEKTIDNSNKIQDDERVVFPCRKCEVTFVKDKVTCLTDQWEDVAVPEDGWAPLGTSVFQNFLDLVKTFHGCHGYPGGWKHFARCKFKKKKN
ncbi:hypothetical protein HELRODRAFT_180305 [Helobdella robusta]|uniref:Uncharacterized protein n=1 Tax=Helobdella robusta TaxID=6412 RepID=T1FFQ1_HELRO|nr:hypothetical protein HELRODRAFT_180305 [Helobdella robusta]ESN94134.1 hypothetical protein HELRODRAFT_180305 [Helobdella robusta]